ncbi:MAG TPA: T9SS type A sorting domain-containing protein [Ignavibacteria bacterium]|nr:T9SS type A sorting domain-containing protein [Ignavibacteria bacterium]
MFLFGDSTRVIRYFYDTGLDDSYFITISPKYGFIGIQASAVQATYYQSLLGCTISGITYGILTAINEEKRLSNKFQLLQNYPNPFNPETVIGYQLSLLSFVTLKVFDVLGREVVTLVNEEKPQGNYTVSFDASKLSSGIYFYTIRAGKFHRTKKMVLLR